MGYFNVKIVENNIIFNYPNGELEFKIIEPKFNNTKAIYEYIDKLKEFHENSESLPILKVTKEEKGSCDFNILYGDFLILFNSNMPVFENFAKHIIDSLCEIDTSGNGDGDGGDGGDGGPEKALGYVEKSELHKRQDEIVEKEEENAYKLRMNMPGAHL